MRKAVVGNRVALRQFAAGEFGVSLRAAPEQEECRLDAFALERIENAPGRTWLGSVVEGEHDLLCRQRECGREVLAANARGRRRVDLEHARGAECIGITGAGRRRGLCCRRRDRERKDHEKWPHRYLAWCAGHPLQ